MDPNTNRKFTRVVRRIARTRPLAAVAALALALGPVAGVAARTPGTVGAPPEATPSGTPQGIARSPDAAPPSFTLRQLLDIAGASSPVLAVGRADEDVARTATLTARAYPNPEIGVEPGRLGARTDEGRSGASTVLSIGQPIENPRLREARLRAAELGVDVATARTRTLHADLAAAVRMRFFELARLREEAVAYGEDLKLTEQIRDRILLRVRVGEAPRFDLVRAESEVEVARKNLATTRLREAQVRATLRALAGPALPPAFDVRSDPDEYRPLTADDFNAMRAEAVARNPDVALAAQQLARAERQVDVERGAVLPQVTLRASHERSPDAQLTRVGALVTLPLLNRREGPIAEARAQVERARLALEQRRFETGAALDAAWQGYATARARIDAIERGILDRARAVLEIAEAAYRLGERGILEYLDAQRQYRLARNELIAARFELQSARSDMERLVGMQ